ncbi:MAG: type II secretion system GspH family protein [Tissierellales bacterium]|jgi:prepilin-type N-terminal cleavage/methylation domain-containing protein|nr:type II secretion system GspH family protein [Tissierellales bacterium]
MKIKKKDGFTLLELILVLAIVSILGAIAHANFSIILKNIKVKADVQTSLSILKSVRLKHISENYSKFDILMDNNDFVNQDALDFQSEGRKMTAYVVARIDENKGTIYAIFYMSPGKDLRPRKPGEAFLIEEGDHSFKVNTKDTIVIKPWVSASGNFEYVFDDVNYQLTTLYREDY